MNKSAEINKRRVRVLLPIPPERKKREIFFFKNHRIQEGVLSVAVVSAHIKCHMIAGTFITKEGLGSLCSDAVVRKISKKLGQICVYLSTPENKLTW